MKFMQWIVYGCFYQQTLQVQSKDQGQGNKKQ